MNPDSIAHARYAVRRLRRRTRVPIVVGFWSKDPADPKAPDLVTATRSDLSAPSLGEAIEEIVKLVLVASASGDNTVTVLNARRLQPAEVSEVACRPPQPRSGLHVERGGERGAGWRPPPVTVPAENFTFS